MSIVNDRDFNNLVDTVSRIDIDWAEPILTPIGIHLNDIKKNPIPTIYWENILGYVHGKHLLSEFINSAFEHTENKSLEPFINLDWSSLKETTDVNDTNNEIEKAQPNLSNTSLSFAALLALISPIFLALSIGEVLTLKTILGFIIFIILTGMILGTDKRRVMNKQQTFRDSLIVGCALLFSLICYFFMTGRGLSGLGTAEEGLTSELLIHRAQILFEPFNIGFYIVFCLIFCPILISISSFASEWTMQSVIKFMQISNTELDSFHKKLKVAIAIITTIVVAFYSIL